MSNFSIHMTDFCKKNIDDFIFMKYFKEILNCNIDVQNPDILLFSVFGQRRGHQHLNYRNCIKLLFSGEQRKVNCKYYDYSITFDDDSKTNLCLPGNFFKNIDDIKLLKSIIQPKNKSAFCNFIYYSNKPKERKYFCKQIQKYKNIDCPGRVLNNMENFGAGRKGDWGNDKIKFIKKYKFTIAFENESADNYVTEKIVHPFKAGSIPIYWGAPNIEDYYDSRCFINVNNFNNFNEAIKYIKEVDKNEELYLSYFDNPPIYAGSKLSKITKEHIYKFLDKVIEAVKTLKTKC